MNSIVHSVKEAMRYARKGEIMFKNYLKIALRNIRRHKAYSLIDIFGLAIGMDCCLFITLWILDELSFDKFHAEPIKFTWRLETAGFHQLRFHWRLL